MPLLGFTVGSELYNSDHFSLIVSYADSGGAIQYPSRYLFQRADWEKFMELADVTQSMVCTEDITEAVQHIVDCIVNAANNAIPKQEKLKERRNCGTFFVVIRRQKIMSVLSVRKPLLVAYGVVVRGNLGLILFLPSHPLLPVNNCGKRSRLLMEYILNLPFLF
ncbi:hypothetical protein AVEN_236453-1 [Araneus ventricosus]|uniref:Uncharacterized protein n=1 Tax=Araneus ventricosus TaxID=182803 RepID=A0A4Y2IWH3_ARAVE|nr:hypothetical protein AVEN_236453-1 [Araneus ventricosus]